MKRLVVFSISLVVCSAAFAQESSSPDVYRVPPKELAEIADAPFTPIPVVGPGDWMALLDIPPLLTIADLAQPELKLAGQRFNPRNSEQTRAVYYPNVRLLRKSTGEMRALSGLPKPARLRNVTFSPDGSKLAFTISGEEAVELWVADIATGSARRLGDRRLNVVSPRPPYAWISDSRALIVRAVPLDRGAAPAAPAVPTGPVVQENIGRRTPGRTYQDLLKTPYDADLFEYHLRSELLRVGLDGGVQTIGKPDLYVRAEPSPDGAYLLVEKLHRPFSFVVPDFRFPRRVEIWTAEGTLVRQIADLPLADTVGTDLNAVAEGVRGAGWRSDQPATAYWVEAQDKGDARREAAIRDRLLTLAAPFHGDAVTLADLPLRFASVYWANDHLALIEESWWKTRQTRLWRIDPSHPGQAPRKVFEYSFEDRYADPGNPLMKKTPWGTSILRLDDGHIYLLGEGASPEGDRPFIDRFHLDTLKATRLWRSEAPFYEYAIDLLDDPRLAITRREAVSEPPNYFLRDLRRKQSRPLTQFPHPTPQLAGATKELIRYKRKDGVDLTGTLYLPPRYEAKKDGPLPVLLWAYPQEFKSASAASQVTDSPYRFIRVSGMSPLIFLVRGYAVLDDPSIPIIGEGKAEPNDTYVEQLVAGAQAAVDELVRRGVGDGRRMAIGGHSYGAFMTANLLAHSDLFRAGIARSGAYNRTLTPFSFQAEERTFWEATETYIRMSPFTHAQKIKEPLLLIHGFDDNNSGTFPIQSERLYQAIKGLGGTVRLVMLPSEAHGYRARESVLHMLWETDQWLERYVKNAKPHATE